MQIAKCSNCGHDVELSDIESKHIRLGIAAAGLIASASVVDLMLQLPQYELAQAGFDERLAEITETIHDTTDSFERWGNGFDD